MIIYCCAEEILQDENSIQRHENFGEDQVKHFVEQDQW